MLETTYYIYFSVLLFLSLITSKHLNTMFYNCFNNPIFANRVSYFCHNTLMHWSKSIINDSSLAINLVLEWKILFIDSWSSIFLYSKTNFACTLKWINLPKKSFNLFLITNLVKISYNSGQTIYKILILWWCTQFSEELDCVISSALAVLSINLTCSSTWSRVVREV